MPTTARRTALARATRRAVQRSADTLVTASSASAGRSCPAASARLEAPSTAAAVCSTSSSVPGSRLAKEIGQEAERRTTRGAVEPRDRDRHRNPTDVGPMTAPAATAIGVQRATRQSCRLPATLRKVLLVGQLRLQAQLHRIRPERVPPSRAFLSPAPGSRTRDQRGADLGVRESFWRRALTLLWGLSRSALGPDR
jgi:hypothetical protein